MRVLLALLLVAIILLAISSSASATDVNVGVTWAPGFGPPCNVGGNPDERVCLSSNQDGVAPLAAPWITVVRDNPLLNWTLSYGSWILNNTVYLNLSNARSANVDSTLDSVLRQVIVGPAATGGRVRFHLLSDTAYIAFDFVGIPRPEAVTWRGSDITFTYDGSLYVTPTFSDGELVVDYPMPGSSDPTKIPFLAGLTNFRPFDVVPRLEDVAAFSCGNVTLIDPRSSSEISDTQSWTFDWGDGTPPTRTGSPTATHLYARPSVYNVTMTVQTDQGFGLAYLGRVDTTQISCAVHILRGITVIVLSFSFVVLAAASFVPLKGAAEPQRRTHERKLRRRAAACLVVVIILVVIL